MAGQGAGDNQARGGGGNKANQQDKLRVTRAFFYKANPKIYMTWILNRYCKDVIQQAVRDHFYSEGRDAVGDGGTIGAPWAGKTKRNIDIRVQRHVPIDLPVLVNSGALRRYVSNNVVIEYLPDSMTVHVGLNPAGRPKYAGAHDAGTFIPNSPYGPIHLAKRPLVRFTVSGYAAVVNRITYVLNRHWDGDSNFPGMRG